MNIYDELINGIAAIGMDIDNLRYAEGEAAEYEIMERMKTNQQKVYKATMDLANAMKAVDLVLNEVYPTAYWHRFDQQMKDLKA